MIDESVMSGFQSSSDVSKSSANLRHKLENLPLLTSDPELHAATQKTITIASQTQNHHKLKLITSSTTCHKLT
jgi:hypothetical protein